MYTPNKAPAVSGDDANALARYYDSELEALAAALQEDLELSPLYVAPAKPRAGMVVYADGTHWDPGAGEGLYFYSSGGLWVPLVGGTLVEATLASGSSRNLTPLTVRTIVTLNVPAGTWDLAGVIVMNNIAGSGVVLWWQVGISLVDAVMPAAGRTDTAGMLLDSSAADFPNNILTIDVGPVRVTFATPTNVFLVANSNYDLSGGTNIAAYGHLRAKRLS